MLFDNKLIARQISPEDWALVAEQAHLLAFQERRPAEMNKISFCVTVEEKEKPGVPLVFATMRELDSESIYWQYGGVFSPAQKSIKTYACYHKVSQFTKELGFKRVTTYVENTNKAMLKLAIDLGFIPIGIRNFKQQILLELLLEF